MSGDIKKIEYVKEKATCHFSGDEWKQKKVNITLHKKKVIHTGGFISVFFWKGLVVLICTITQEVHLLIAEIIFRLL